MIIVADCLEGNTCIFYRLKKAALCTNRGIFIDSRQYENLTNLIREQRLTSIE
jgi:mRNA degradation ribonuclease J1/J2